MILIYLHTKLIFIKTVITFPIINLYLNHSLLLFPPTGKQLDYLWFRTMPVGAQWRHTGSLAQAADWNDKPWRGWWVLESQYHLRYHSQRSLSFPLFQPPLPLCHQHLLNWVHQILSRLDSLLYWSVDAFSTRF